MVKQFVFIVAFLLVWINLFSDDVAGQKNNDEQITAQNREKIRQILIKESVPGIGIAVIKNGRTVWNEGFGLAHIEMNSPATTETRFGIGSISKSLTMVLAARLAEAGLLELDAPLEKYLPDYPHKNQGVTIRLIGGHLSGYADRFGNDYYYNTRRFENTQQVLQEFYKEPLAAQPGEKSIYGTTTFTLVAAVIEKITGKDFGSAMNEWVLKPLGLKNILLNDRREIVPHRTAFYIRSDHGKIVNGEFVDPSFKLAGAGFLATAEDLARFGAALIEEGFLKRRTLDELFQPVTTAAGEKTEFALGFRVRKGADGREIIYQPGGGVGISSVLFIDRQHKVSVAILTNRTGAPIGNPDFLRGLSDSFIK